tara:strand:- start:362 stop:838 length:477 start_codon:yes stop_codon:yes gene_type:complete
MEKLIGQKHAVKCRCILPQFKKRKEPVFHEFVVFSKIINGNFEESFEQCNNCGIVHKVVDFCKSKIVDGQENIRTLRKIADISIGLDHDLVSLLKSSNADIATFKEMEFIVENSIYNKKILLEKETVDSFVVGKFLTFLENGRFKVEPFSYQLGIKDE